MMWTLENNAKEDNHEIKGDVAVNHCNRPGDGMAGMR